MHHQLGGHPSRQALAPRGQAGDHASNAFQRQLLVQIAHIAVRRRSYTLNRPVNLADQRQARRKKIVQRLRLLAAFNPARLVKQTQRRRRILLRNIRTNHNRLAVFVIVFYRFEIHFEQR